MVAAVLVAAGCGQSRHSPHELVVVSGSDAESILLADIYAGALRSYGFAARAEQAPDPLSRLDSGAASVVAAFTGKVLQTFERGAMVRSDQQVYRMMVAALPEGLAAGDYATAAEDKPALALTQATAGAWGGTDLNLVPRHCDGMAVGSVVNASPPAAVSRCQLPKTLRFPDEKAMFAALRAGQINAGWTTTADPMVPPDVVLLTDGTPALVQAENVVPLYRRNELSDRQLLAINEVAGVLDTAALLDMQRQVAGGLTAQSVADAWLGEHPLGR